MPPRMRAITKMICELARPWTSAPNREEQSREQHHVAGDRRRRPATCKERRRRSSRSGASRREAEATSLRVKARLNPSWVPFTAPLSVDRTGNRRSSRTATIGGDKSHVGPRRSRIRHSYPPHGPPRFVGALSWLLLLAVTAKTSMAKIGGRGRPGLQGFARTMRGRLEAGDPEDSRTISCVRATPLGPAGAGARAALARRPRGAAPAPPPPSPRSAAAPWSARARPSSPARCRRSRRC
jgi:hypothetical protein